LSVTVTPLRYCSLQAPYMVPTYFQILVTLLHAPINLTGLFHNSPCMLNSDREGSQLKAQLRRYRETVGQTVHTHCASVHEVAKLVTALLRVAGGNCRPGGKYWQPTARFMTQVTRKMTAKNRDQLWNPTLGNPVWATFTFFLILR